MVRCEHGLDAFDGHEEEAGNGDTLLEKREKLWK